MEHTKTQLIILLIFLFFTGISTITLLLISVLNDRFWTVIFLFPMIPTLYYMSKQIPEVEKKDV
jgi:4-hydroxybenzoate polyprenyltransferase